MKERKAWGYWAVNGMDVLFLEDVNNGRVFTRFSTGGRGVWSTMKYDGEGRVYFMRGGTRFFMDELMTME